MELLNPKSARDIKRKLAQEMLSQPAKYLSNPLRWQTELHGIGIEFRFHSQKLFDEASSFLPPSQKAAELTVDWVTTEVLDPQSSMAWDQESNPDLMIENFDVLQSVSQRDFLGLWLKENHYLVATHAKISDGFYNSLRWFLPHLLLKKNTLLLHSSCVIDRHGKARIFLGPSGAGKTTVASLASGRMTLGDDMNVVLVEEDGIFAETAWLGGNPKYHGPRQKKFPVAGFYWLEQSEEIQISPLSSLELTSKLIVSCPLAGWMNDQAASERLLNLASRCALLGNGQRLFFQKNNQFWRLIDEQSNS